MDSFFLFDRSTGMVMAVPTAVACFQCVLTHASYVSAQ